MIETINKLAPTSRQSILMEKVHKVLKIAKEPISLETPIGDEEDSQYSARSRPRASSRRARCGASGKRTGRAFSHDGRFGPSPKPAPAMDCLTGEKYNRLCAVR